MDLRFGRRMMLLAVAAGLLLRVAFALGYWTGKPLTHDEREYLALARSLTEGHGFNYPADYDSGTSPRFGRAPGYPFFLALLGAPDAPAAPNGVKLANSVLGALTIWIIGSLARQCGGTRAGVIAAWMAALYPPLLWLPAYVFSESLSIPLGLAAVSALVFASGLAARERSPRAGAAFVVVAGVVTGVAALVRSATLLFVPLVALWFVKRRQWALALAFCVSAAAIVSPWMLRNAREYGRLVIGGSEGGVTFWTGNHPLARGEGDLAANPDIKAAEIAFRAAHPGMNAYELESVYYRDAIATIRANPGWWVALTAKKAFFTVVPIGPSYTLHSTRYLMASVISFGLIAPLGIAGIVRLLRRGHSVVPLVLLTCSVLLTSVIFFPQERFRVPVIDPTLIVGASVMLASLRRRQ